MKFKIFQVSVGLNSKDYNFLGFIQQNMFCNYSIGYGAALSLLITDYLSRYSLDKLKAENINLSQIKEGCRFKIKNNKIKIIHAVSSEISEEHFVLINHLKYLYKISNAEILRRIISGFREMYKNDKDNQNMLTNLIRIYKEYKNGIC